MLVSVGVRVCVGRFDLISTDVACAEFTMQFKTNQAASRIESKEDSYMNREVVIKINLLDSKRGKKMSVTDDHL